ncbi:MAG: hypothetical protein PHD20_02780 [Clostridia bacterium]|nr:hypothetical protein [Clostridia bacterium]
MNKWEKSASELNNEELVNMYAIIVAQNTLRNGKPAIIKEKAYEQEILKRLNGKGE